MSELRDTDTTRRAHDVSLDELLIVNDLRKYYPLESRMPWSRAAPRQVRAVDGISFGVPQNHAFSLVGESGCGKTTTAKLVLGLVVPDSGEIRLHGTEIGRDTGRRRRFRGRIQAVFQDPWSSLNPRMRIGDAIGEPLLVNTDIGGSQLRDRVAELLDSVGLPAAVARNYPHEFSGGQRQRIALARALSLEPDLVVLDEPVSALDVSIRAQVMNLLKDLQRQRRLSYLLIAHDLATVRYLSDTVGVMYLGKLVEVAPAPRLFRRPAHPYTHALIDAASQDVTGRERIVLSGDVPSPANPPSGCHFHPRCWLYQQIGRPEKCRTDQPTLVDAASGHQAACHFAEDAMTSGRNSEVVPSVDPDPT